MFKKYGIWMIVLVMSFFSCNKFDKTNTDLPIDNEEGMEQLVISDLFNYTTAKEVDIEISAKDNAGNPIPKVRFNIYTDDPAEGGSLILSGMTNQSGMFSRTYEFPAYYTEVVVTTPFIGLPQFARINIDNQKIQYTFGGAEANLKTNHLKSVTQLKSSDNYSYLGNYNSEGVPDYLEAVNDVIGADLLEDINNTLPEQVWLPVGHPQYFDENNRYDISLIEACNVYVTFVHEGAGYTNSMGFYVYDTDNPPATVNDIDEITIIFPNISYKYSGGGLVSGNKVKIGTFPANKSIGWVIIQKGWSNGTVVENTQKFYSNPDFNPETNSADRQHTVLINDLGRNLILLGFEDLKRVSGCDHDFNDAVFYITADPVQAVDLSNLPSIDYTGNDTDTDGVDDEMDDYPNDPDKAFNNYFFAEGTYGTIAFEDMWPATGDYDFNDMVIDYNFNQITNADNDVVEIYGEFVLKAFGASFHNGFGIDLGIDPSLISKVEGYKLQESWPDINSKGLENNQDKAVFLVFDDTYNLMARTGGIGVNTDPSYAFVTPDTTRIHISLSQAVPLESIGVPPYNPFMIVNQDRGHEIHLPDHAPTDLANPNLLGTSRDDSNPATGRYYKTENNLPWAIKIIEQFDYPVEKKQILNAHLKFADWAESGGIVFTDWYKDLSGYRNDANIYQKP